MKTPNKSILENVVSLYVIHIFNYIVPLLMIPYLTRHLGVVGWGEFAIAEALARYLTLFIEYGFTLSGTREVARNQEQPEARSTLLSGIIGAQALLAVTSITVGFILSRTLPAFQGAPWLFWSGIVWGILDAFNLMWYFQGLERTRVVAIFDVSARAVSVILTFLFVRGPEDGWLVFCFRGISSALSVVFCLHLAYKEIPFRRPAATDARRMLKDGFAMFLLRSSINLYLLGNVLILGIFAPPAVVGLYSGAEKISRAAIAMLNPVTQALYPRISKLLHAGDHGAKGLIRIAMAAMGSGGVLTALSITIAAPLIVRVLLGKEFAEATIILRLLCLLHPIVALNNVLGIQWMIPHGRERQFNYITIGGGLVNLALGLILVPRIMQFGIVWSVITAEILMFAAIIVTCRELKISPFGSD